MPLYGIGSTIVGLLVEGTSPPFSAFIIFLFDTEAVVLSKSNITLSSTNRFNISASFPVLRSFYISGLPYTFNGSRLFNLRNSINLE
nr:MAG TPA: hypothetical protein [Bacteriophage sp.]